MDDVMRTDGVKDDVDSVDESQSMEELLKKDAEPLFQGKIINVKVVGDNKDGYLVDLGMKSEGLILKAEFENDDAPARGQEFEVMLLSPSSDYGYALVSYRKAKEKAAWVHIEEAVKGHKPLKGKIRKKIKGGFSVDIGVNAFLPMSQLDIRPVKNPDEYVGREFDFVITELKKEESNIVVSRRKLLEEERNKMRNELFAKIKEGDEVEGKVTNLADFGAFVDIGGIEGLVHVSDLAWHRVDRASSVLKIGQKVKAKILKIEKMSNKISLGMKQLTQNPWENAAKKYSGGSTIHGRIKSITDFGLFVELEPGVEGLVHQSEISWKDKEPNLKHLFKLGQEVDAKVLSIDAVAQKISLSLKRLQENPWELAKKHYPVNSKVKGKITHFAPFGAFVQLNEGIEGLIHVTDLSWKKKIKHPKDILTPGQEVELVVLDVDAENEKISLSLKHLEADPYKKYMVGAVVTGIVKRISDFGAFVELEPEIDALVRTQDISQKKIENPAELLKAGDTIEAKVIKSDYRERKIDISIKKLENDRERELIKKYVNKVQKATLGDVLEEEE